MDNMYIYKESQKVPQTALRQITDGRLKGKSDINPMWRIKKLTELFGPAGIGWYYKIIKKWLEPGANDEICAFVDIELYIKYNDEWSKPIEGTGGSKLVTKESRGMHTSDEAYKMALTDAISVACKALGFAADIYWQNGTDSKYTTQTPKKQPAMPPAAPEPITKEQKDKIYYLVKQLAEQMATPADKILERITAGFGTNVEGMTMTQGINCYKQLAENLKKTA